MTCTELVRGPLLKSKPLGKETTSYYHTEHTSHNQYEDKWWTSGRTEYLNKM